MNKFKVGDEVKAIGIRAGNPFFNSAIVTQTPDMRVDKRYQVRENGKTQLWSVYVEDLELINNEVAIAFTERFLSKEGKQLLKDGYIEAKIVASKKMRDEMEVVAVDAFLSSRKIK